VEHVIEGQVKEPPMDQRWMRRRGRPAAQGHTEDTVFVRVFLEDAYPPLQRFERLSLVEAFFDHVTDCV
jgi:hypothetical protein